MPIKSPLTPLCQRKESTSPFAEREIEGDFNAISRVDI